MSGLMNGHQSVRGMVAAGFEAVRQAFAAVAAEEPGLGAQLAVRHRGRQVVDLWTGPDLTGDSRQQGNPAVVLIATPRTSPLSRHEAINVTCCGQQVDGISLNASRSLGSAQ
ncbi:hypothetical protein [Nonomuraea rubra]|uniref:hypothetical protein n=1 Tax=Nonomuraea rubra TaxID=46180 RepID=UPI0033EDDB41